MLDAYIPSDALTADAEAKLLNRCTDLLLEHEGVDPANERARSVAWVYDRERRAAITSELTDAVVAFGRVLGLGDIAAFVNGEQARAHGERRIAARRRETARELLDVAGAQAAT